MPPLRGVIFALVLASCAAEAPERRPPAAVAVPRPAPDDDTRATPRPAGTTCDDSKDPTFESVWPRLRAHLEAGVEGLAPLVDPARGLFVLDNPGAFVVPMHFHSVAGASEKVPRLTPQHYRLSCPEARNDATPHFSCETEEWSTSGCVITKKPSFSVSRWYELAIQYEVLPEAEARQGLEKARLADAAISDGVYSTDAGFGFYFGRVGCVWRLLAIDAVMPCSA